MDTPNNPLPLDVLAALELSPVSAINVLQKYHGLSLLEAKRLVDAYMERQANLIHAKAETSGLAEPQQAISPSHQTGISAQARPYISSVEHGIPLLFEELQQRIPPPEAYVIGQSSVTDEGNWANELLRACTRAVGDTSLMEIVDEEMATARGDIAGITIKICAPGSLQTLSATIEEFSAPFSGQAIVRLVQGLSLSNITFLPSELEVEYFRREFAVDSQMISHTTSCARLTHAPTGISCRSTAHRSRIRNYEEALLLLASLVKDM